MLVIIKGLVGIKPMREQDKWKRKGMSISEKEPTSTCKNEYYSLWA